MASLKQASWAKDPSSNHPLVEITAQLEYEMPGLWSERNLPTPSAMLKVIRAVCACPVIASDKGLSNGTPNGVATHSLSNGTPNSAASWESHVETLENGVAFKEDCQHTPTSDTIISQEGSPESNSRGHSNIYSISSNASATPITTISNTPLNMPNPVIYKLEDLSLALNFYNLYLYEHPYLPLAPLSAPDYALSVHPIYPQSLNSAPLPQQYYHHLLRFTSLHSGSSTITLRTVALGRIHYRRNPTYWIVAMEIQHGNLYALRSTIIAPDELLDESDDDDELAGYKPITPVLLPEFDKNKWKAVLLGDTTILELDRGVGSGTEGRYQALMVESWDSIYCGQ